MIEDEIADEEINSDVKPGKPFLLDVDFVIILLFALTVDGLDIILDTLGLLAAGIGKIVGILLDIAAFVIIGAWMYWRGKQPAIGGNLGKKLAESKGKIIKRIEAKIAQKISGRMLRRAVFRGGLALIIEVIPGLGLCISWTLLVISALF